MGLLLNVRDDPDSASFNSKQKIKGQAGND